jgi:DNA-binding response OmpR family regulator
MEPPTVVVVSNNPNIQQALAAALAKCGIAPIHSANAAEVRALLQHRLVSLMFCSDELPGSELNLLIRQNWLPVGRIPTVVVSRRDDWEHFVKFLQAGALDYVLYPLDEVEVLRVVRNALGLLQPKQSQKLAKAG